MISIATRTNRLLGATAAVLLLPSVAFGFLKNNSNIQNDADREFYEVLESPNPFPSDTPSRFPTLLQHPFRSEIFEAPSGYGGDQPTYISHLYPMPGPKLTCESEASWWLDCSVAKTKGDEYMLTVSSSTQSSNSAMQEDSIQIEVFVKVKKFGKTFASTVLTANLRTSKCASRNSAGFLEINKIKVSGSEVFVISLQGSYLDVPGLSKYEVGSPSHDIVIGANSTGMPEVLASYAGTDLIQIASSDRSLLLTYSDDDFSSETANGYTGSTVIELVPTKPRWTERIHRIASMGDPLWIASIGVGIKGAAKPNLNRPTKVFSYESQTYDDFESEPACK